MSEEKSPHDTAVSEAELFLTSAKLSIDSKFGEGFAKANPVLVAAFLQSCASSVATHYSSRTIGLGIAGAIDRLSQAVANASK